MRDIAPPLAPLHIIPRGHAGPKPLAMVLFEKIGQHQPRNRQSVSCAHEGVELSLPAPVPLLRPLHGLSEHHVIAAQLLHGDDTPAPILAKSKTEIGRPWV